VKLQPRDYACIAVGVGVVVYDLLAQPKQTISDAADAYLAAAPVAAELVMLAVYLHVANKLPARVDPIHLAFGALKALRI
jgi:hypothetical protein